MTTNQKVRGSIPLGRTTYTMTNLRTLRAPDFYMQKALTQAAHAAVRREVPIGAVIVYQNRIIGRGYNLVETKQDAMQHAELIALRQASRHLKSWRLLDCDLYVTLEPCAMCAGAITWSRIKKVFYGADDPKAGAYRSALQVLGHKKLNHQPQVITGILADASSKLLKDFFKRLRK